FTPRHALFILSLHDALPIWLSPQNLSRKSNRQLRRRIPHPPENLTRKQPRRCRHFSRCRALFLHILPCFPQVCPQAAQSNSFLRSEEHTSELQSRFDLVCRL